MANDLYIWVVRWNDFQHYKPNPDRGPAWIKTHTAQLSDERYQELSDRRRSLLHDVRMLFASWRLSLPYDARMLAKQRGVRTRYDDLEALAAAGLIEIISRVALEARLDKVYSRSRAEVEVDLEVDLEEPSFLPTSTYNGGRKEGTEKRVRPKTEAELVAERELPIPGEPPPRREPAIAEIPSAFQDMPQ